MDGGRANGHGPLPVLGLVVAAWSLAACIDHGDSSPEGGPDTGAAADTTDSPDLDARGDVGGGDDSGAGPDAAPGDGSASGPVTPESVIRNLADIVSGQLSHFVTAMEALTDAVEAHAEAPTNETLAAARERWREAASSWQVLELMQLGPAGTMEHVVGGQDLRDEIYSWPVDNPCRVDQETVSQGYADPGFVEQPPNVRGLDALEYLLFVDGDDNACAANSGINRSGEWAALDSDEIDRRRAEFAVVVADLALGHARELVAAWDPETGAFYEALVTAGDGSRLFDTRRDALNSISDALFYLDTETKDMKLARPAGLSGCAESTCRDEVESLYARASVAHIGRNLDGFSLLYHGGPADGPEPGFHELLIERGAERVAAEMASALAAASSIVDPAAGSLFDRVTSDIDGVGAMYDAVKRVTDLLKTELIGVLDLEVPNRAAGDND